MLRAAEAPGTTAASHLLMLEAVAGPALLEQVYGEAVYGGYLWHEFGDSNLLPP